MRAELKRRPDVLLLLSLLLLILLHPVLDRGIVRNIFLGVLSFVPVILATIRLSQIKGWLWQSLLLAAGIVIFSFADQFWPSPAFSTIKWGFLAVYFGLVVVGLFSYILDTESITSSHLIAAVSIYLLLALVWFALYCAVASVDPGAILTGRRELIEHRSEILYFSLATLTTLGYGDVVAAHSVVAHLAVLQAVAGVLYIAITVAILVGGYRRPSSS
jgi:hypothetical protein